MYVLWKLDGFVTYDFGCYIRWLKWFVCVTPVYLVMCHSWMRYPARSTRTNWYRMRYRKTNWGRTPPVSGEGCESLLYRITITCVIYLWLKSFDYEISNDQTILTVLVWPTCELVIEMLWIWDFNDWHFHLWDFN